MLYWPDNGQTQCDQLVTCSDSGSDTACKTYPYASYFFEAIGYFNNYLIKLDAAIVNCAGDIAFTQTQINEFAEAVRPFFAVRYYVPAT